MQIEALVSAALIAQVSDVARFPTVGEIITAIAGFLVVWFIKKQDKDDSEYRLQREKQEGEFRKEIRDEFRAVREKIGKLFDVHDNHVREDHATATEIRKSVAAVETKIGELSTKVDAIKEDVDELRTEVREARKAGAI
jgi:uncharacterized coiled-coil DUF342 family protein